MNYNKLYRKLGRRVDYRKVMLKNMIIFFIKVERIEIIVIRVKELRKFVERMIIFGKKNILVLRRNVFVFLRDEEVVVKIFNEIVLKYVERNGGYIRIIKIFVRKGDLVEMVIIELV